MTQPFHYFLGEFCENCGATNAELSSAGDRGNYHELIHCTGNAYVCRVARKIPPIVRFYVTPAGEEPMTRHFYRVKDPWEMTPADLCLAVHSNIPQGIDNSIVWSLCATIRTNPAVCPVLADAIEEAGCDDQELLDALRTN